MSSDIVLKTITNFHEYIDYIHDISAGRRLWYRGQSYASQRLIPSAHRLAVQVTDWGGRPIKPELLNFSGGKSGSVVFPNYWKMLSEFKEKAKDLLLVTPQNDLEWLSIAQHYGIPTPFLDWSTDPLVALYFATCNAPTNYYKMKEILGDDFEENITDEFSMCCSAIFAIDPGIINSPYFKNPNEAVPFDIDRSASIIKSHMDSEVAPPICVLGQNYDKRMCRQSGNFTVFSKQTFPFDFFGCNRKGLIKILIPFISVKSILAYLRDLDISNDSLYFGKDKKDEIAAAIARECVEGFKHKFPDLFKNGISSD